MAKFNLLINPEAIDDIQNAVDYYSSKRDGLGSKFFIDLQRKPFISVDKV
jgi:hypothetical protein